jgi:uncharacterized protein YndB with AHSA1/START domain
MAVETTESLRITRVIGAPRDAVWDAITQPEQMKQWMCPAPNGVEVCSADVRVGGTYEIQMAVDGKRHKAVGTYREIEKPSRLVYTWDWRDSEMDAMGDTLVTIELNEVDGGTELVLVHEGLPAPDAKDGHEQGWTACLTHLEAMFA